MLHVDERAGLVVTHDTVCGRVEQLGRKLQCCMQTGGLVGSQLAMLRAIGLRAESRVVTRLGLGWSVLLGAWPVCDRVWG